MVSYVITAYILAFCLSVTIDVARCAFECQKATPLKIYTIMTSKSNDRFGLNGKIPNYQVFIKKVNKKINIY